MEKPLDYISLGNFLWIQFNEGFISFGSEKLPENIHYTFSFNPNSEYANLHVTKNTSDPTNKPQIKIVRIKHTDLERFLNNLNQKLLGMILKPLDIKAFKVKHRYKVAYLSHEKLQNGNLGKAMEGKLIDLFKPYTTVKRKSRVKINKGFEVALEGFAGSKEIIDLILNHVERVPRKHTQIVEGGILLTKKETLSVVRIGNQWFEINHKDKMTDILTHLADEHIAVRLSRRIKRAIVLVHRAKTYQEVEKYNKNVPSFFYKDNVQQ